MYGHNKTLLDVLRLGLQSDSIELKDTIITYIALTNLTEAANIIEDYIFTEELPWLAEYADRVMRHLRAILQGKSSLPPIVEDVDTAVMERSESLELRWRSRFPELEDEKKK